MNPTARTGLMMLTLRRLALLHGLALLSLAISTTCAISLLCGCDRSTPNAGPASTAKVRVLATVYPLADVIRRIGADYADVQWLMESGQSLEGYSPSELMDRAAQTRIVVTSGPADDWAQRVMSMDARATRLVEPQTTAAAMELYGGGNPDAKASLWLDPRTVAELTDVMRERLSGADAAHAQAFAANATSIRQSIETLDAEIRQGLAALENKRLLTVRPVWGAFCRRYGLEQVAPVQSREERLTPQDFRDLAQAARESDARAIFVDISTPAPVRQHIAERTRLDVLTLDTLGTSAPAGNSTYEKMMRYNLRQLTRGLSRK